MTLIDPCCVAFRSRSTGLTRTSRCDARVLHHRSGIGSSVASFGMFLLGVAAVIVLGTEPSVARRGDGNQC